MYFGDVGNPGVFGGIPVPLFRIRLRRMARPAVVPIIDMTLSSGSGATRLCRSRTGLCE